MLTIRVRPVDHLPQPPDDPLALRSVLEPPAPDRASSSRRCAKGCSGSPAGSSGGAAPQPPDMRVREVHGVSPSHLCSTSNQAAGTLNHARAPDGGLTRRRTPRGRPAPLQCGVGDPDCTGGRGDRQDWFDAHRCHSGLRVRVRNFPFPNYTDRSDASAYFHRIVPPF